MEGAHARHMQLDTVTSAALDAATRADLLRLLDAAYDEPMAEYVGHIGDGLHLLGRVDGQLVSHLMVVPRTLGLDERWLHTAYIELVATDPAWQGRGYASHLLQRCVPLLREFDIAALSPSDAAFYERRGWLRWTGPLGVRTSHGVQWIPGEEAMVLPLAGTPMPLDRTRPLTIDDRPGEVW